MSKDEQILIPSWLWLWAPLFLVLLYFGYFILDRLSYVHDFHNFMQGEFGIIENVTVLLALAAIVPIVLSLRNCDLKGQGLFKAYLTIFALGCFFTAGEELSWGQHFFGWSTPESLAAINKQQETNLHNINGFANKTRTILSSLLFIFGALLPLYRKFKHQRLHSLREKKYWWLWPSFSLVCVGILSFLVALPQRLELVGIQIPIPNNIAEIKECLLTFGFFLYALALYLRLKTNGDCDADSQTPPQAPTPPDAVPPSATA